MNRQAQGNLEQSTSAVQPQESSKHHKREECGSLGSATGIELVSPEPEPKVPQHGPTQGHSHATTQPSAEPLLLDGTILQLALTKGCGPHGVPLTNTVNLLIAHASVQLECAGPLLLSPLRNSPLHVYRQSGCTTIATCTPPAWVTAAPPPQCGCQREQASPAPPCMPQAHSHHYSTRLQSGPARPAQPTATSAARRKPGSTKAALGKQQRQPIHTKNKLQCRGTRTMESKFTRCFHRSKQFSSNRHHSKGANEHLTENSND